jgi:predicted enzyme related to lactoylglutathione lyase
MAQTIEDHALAVGKTFVWHECYGPSSAAAVEFYTKALGWTTETMNMGDFDYTMFVANGKTIAGVMGTAENPDMKDVPPHWSTYIGVDDVDARLAKCIDLGAHVLVGPMDVPTVGRMALIQDPQGATFWLFKDAQS